MLGVLAIAAGGLALLVLLGTPVLLLLPRAARTALLPAVPVLGVGSAVVVLHATTLVLPVRLGVVVLAVLSVAGAVAGLRRADRGLDAGAWCAVRPVLAGLAAGLVPLALALVPTAVYDGELVQPTSNHDGYYYLGVNEWVQDHRGTEQPQLGPGPESSPSVPFEASALRHVQQHLRLGESLVQAGLNTVLGLDAERSWYVLACLWLMLLALAVTAALRLLGFGVAVGALSGLVVALSPLVLQQVYNQNSASVLGLALAPLALLGVAEALSDRPRVPLWLSAGMAGAWLGTYTEYATVALPAWVLVLLLRHPGRLPAALGRTARLAALAVVLAPLVWLNAVRSLVFLAGLPATPWQSPFSGVPASVLLARVTGAAAPLNGVPVTALQSALGAVLALTLVAGLVALVVAPRRWLWVSVAVALAAATAQLSASPDRGYSQQRLVEIGVPLVVLAGCVGWAALAGGPGPLSAAQRSGAAALSLLVALAWVGTSLATDLRLARSALATPRPVDADFAQAAGWVSELGGPGGRDVSVLAGGFFDQLWLAEALRSTRQVAYPVLDPSYFTTESFWSGERDRYVLVDAAAFVDVPDIAVVRRNARFSLLDTRQGAVTVAVTLGYSAGAWYGSEPGPAVWMTDGGRLLVWRNALAVSASGAVDLQLAANPDLPAVPVDVLAAGRPLKSGVVVPAPGSLRVPLPSSVGVVLTLANRVPASVAASVGDPRPLSVRLLGVRNGR